MGMVKLSELRTADDIHRESMKDPEYRRAYYRAWLPDKILWLWLQLRKLDRMLVDGFRHIRLR